MMMNDDDRFYMGLLSAFIKIKCLDISNLCFCLFFV